MDRRNVLAIISLLSICGIARAQEPDPWALRDHYSFSGEHAILSYDVKGAVWKIDVDSLGTVVDNATAQAVLADGRILSLNELEYMREGRTRFADTLGAGTYYRSQFMSDTGLAFRFTVARYTERPFLVTYLEVANTTDAPIEVASLRPAVIRGDDVRLLDQNANAYFTRTQQRGRYPMFRESGSASLVHVQPAPDWVLGLGVLQTGRTESSVVFDSRSGIERAFVESYFDPPLRLPPHRAYRADPAWVSFGISDPSRVREFHAWAQSSMPGPHQGRAIPKAWVTVAPGMGADALYRAAKQWKDRNITHVLVPIDWQAAPGVLEGAAPAFPEDMREVAERIRRMGMVPGITVEPLAIREGADEWTYTTSTNTRWINVVDETARARAAMCIREISNLGFKFFVLQPSAIPDSALTHFRVQRAEADFLAFEIVARAVEGRPVLPQSEIRLDDDPASWLAAADTTFWYPNYSVVPGPVEFEVDGRTKITPQLADAIGRFAGPVELRGKPKPSVRKQISEIFASSVIPAPPLVAPVKEDG